MFRATLRWLLLLTLILVSSACSQPHATVGESVTDVQTLDTTGKVAGVSTPDKATASAVVKPQTGPSTSESAGAQIKQEKHLAPSDVQKLRKTSSFYVFDDLSAADTVSQELGRHNSKANLSMLRSYEKHITAKDLVAFADPVATRKLETLNISGLDLTDDDIAPLKDLKLINLNVNDNKLESLDVLEKMNSLKELDAGGMPLSHAAFNRIAQLTHLTHLDLSYTPLQDKDLEKISNLPELLQLGVVNCNITYGALKAFHNKHKLCAITSATRPKIAENSLSKIEKLMKDQRFSDVDKATTLLINTWQSKQPPDLDSMSFAYALLGKSAGMQHRETEAKEYFEKGKKLYLRRPSQICFWDGGDVLASYAEYEESKGHWKEAFDIRMERDKILVTGD